MEYSAQTFELTAVPLAALKTAMPDPIHSIDADDAMHAWLRACSNPLTVTEVAAAIAAGLIIADPENIWSLYTATTAGRKWLVANAIANGSTEREAIDSLDYIEGA